jgi:hypothetical protein
MAHSLDVQQHQSEIESTVSAPIGKLRATINAGRGHLLAEFCLARAILTAFASGQASAPIAFVRAVQRLCVTLARLAARSVGKHRLLSSSAPAPTLPSHTKFLSSLLQDFRGIAAAATALHCTARASNAKPRVALRPRDQRKHRNRSEACTERPYRPPIRSPPAFLGALAPLPQRLKILHHLHRVSLPTCDCPALTALTPSKAATSFRFRPHISLYFHNDVFHIITIRPFGAPPLHHHYPYTQ